MHQRTFHWLKPLDTLVCCHLPFKLSQARICLSPHRGLIITPANQTSRRKTRPAACPRYFSNAQVIALLINRARKTPGFNRGEIRATPAKREGFSLKVKHNPLWQVSDD